MPQCHPSQRGFRLAWNLDLKGPWEGWEGPSLEPHFLQQCCPNHTIGVTQALQS